MNPLPLLATIAGLLGLFAVCEFASRRGLAPEATRRLAHMGGAGVAALFPLYLSLADVVSLAILASLFLCWTWLRGSLRSIHGVTRPTFGALLFPVGLLLAAFLVWEHPRALAYAALVLALADPAAAALGGRWRAASWTVPGGRKTLAGTLAFFSVTATLGMVLSVPSGEMRFPAVLGAAAILAVIEGTLGYGLDNLPIPPLAALLGASWLQL